jgi:hypothetical protein
VRGNADALAREEWSVIETILGAFFAAMQPGLQRKSFFAVRRKKDWKRKACPKSSHPTPFHARIDFAV